MGLGIEHIGAAQRRAAAINLDLCHAPRRLKRRARPAAGGARLGRGVRRAREAEERPAVVGVALQVLGECENTVGRDMCCLLQGKVL